LERRREEPKENKSYVRVWLKERSPVSFEMISTKKGNEEAKRISKQDRSLLKEEGHERETSERSWSERDREITGTIKQSKRKCERERERE